MCVYCESFVLSGRGLCDEPIKRPEESYRLWCVVCDVGTSRMRRPWPALGCCARKDLLTFYTGRIDYFPVLLITFLC